MRPAKAGHRGEYPVGASPQWLNVLRQVAEVVPDGNRPVLILGERGTGKRLVARLIHQMGPRRGRHFEALNLLAVPTMLMQAMLFGFEGRSRTGSHRRHSAGTVEKARDGTLFLGYIATLELPLQAQLLRMFEDRCFRRMHGESTLPFEARLMCGAHDDLLDDVQHGRLLRELYDHVADFVIHVPPLRERRGDIPLIAQQALATLFPYRPRLHLTDESLRYLQTCEFEENVRGLMNLIEMAGVTTTGDEIGVAQLRR